MRNVFCHSMIKAVSRPEFVFLTGDLGYKALEPLREVMGSRFINAGVAEQNMVSSRPGWRDLECDPGSTVSLRLFMPGLLSRFGMTSACTISRSCWSVMGVVMATA